MSHRFRKRADGSVYTQVRYRIGGRESSISFDDHAEALKFDNLVTQLGAPKALEISRIVAAPAKSLTLADWLKRHNDHLTGIEAGTLARYRAYATNDINPVIGAIPLAALTSDDIAAWVNGLRDKNGNRPSGKTIANKHGYLAGALNVAVERGHIKSNPCDGKKLPRWDRQEMVFLTKDEFRVLSDALPAYWRPLVGFLVASGCRWSEATALKPPDVDQSTGTVRIRRAWKTGQGGYEIGVPKTKKSVRTINVPKRILARLDYSGEWIFTNSGRGRGNFADKIVRDDDSPVRIHSFHPNVWVPALDRAAKEGLKKRPRIHDLRHTCASWLLQSGTPLTVVQQHLGHESITTTVGVYGHLDRHSGEQAAAAIDAMLA